MLYSQPQASTELLRVFVSAKQKLFAIVRRSCDATKRNQEVHLSVQISRLRSYLSMRSCLNSERAAASHACAKNLINAALCTHPVMQSSLKTKLQTLNGCLAGDCMAD